MVSHRAISFAFAIVLALGQSAMARTWTDATGKFRIDAEFVRVTNDSVVLKKTTGETINVPIAKLSDRDQRYVRQKLSATPDSAASGVAGGELAELEKLAKSQRTAAEAVKVYRRFLASDAPAEQMVKASERVTHWQRLADEEYVRQGDEWLSAKDAVDREKTEERLIDESLRMFDVENTELGLKKLREASRANPGSIQPDFMLGLLNALAMRDASQAEKHFSSCVRARQENPESLHHAERANLVASLNNLAIAKVRKGEYRSGVNFWKTASELAPASPELIQNLGRMNLLGKTHEYLEIPTSTQKSVGDLYAKMAVASDAADFSENTGWLYMKYFEEPKSESWLGTESTSSGAASVSTESSLDTGKAVLVGGGTGFVVHKGYVVTNKHVVETAHSVAIVHGKEPENRLSATVVAVAANDDLALVHCPDLDAPPVQLANDVPRLASDIIVMGYPDFTSLGQDLKVTRGVISGLPNPRLDDMLLYDAVTNPGNSGGPVCSQTGVAVAVHTAGIHNPRGGKLAAGVPTGRLLAFVKKHLPEISASASAGAKRDWADVVDEAGKSVVNVLIFQDPKSVDYAKRLAQASQEQDRNRSFDALEDPWCMACHGHGEIDCRAQGCVKGRIKGLVNQPLGANAAGRVLMRKKTVVTACKRCRGIGTVSCPVCVRGLDPSVTQ